MRQRRGGRIRWNIPGAAGWGKIVDLSTIFDAMRADDIPHWKPGTDRAAALAAIAESVGGWLEINAPDCMLSIGFDGGAGRGGDWVRVEISRPRNSAARSFKVGSAES